MSSSSDKVDDILNYYSVNRESERHLTQQLEFALMEKALKSLLSEKPLRILELGAGSGYYTKILAEMGHQVVALEPVRDLLEENKRICTQRNLAQQVQWIESDARNLQAHVTGEFDVVLNMGPYYHLINEADRKSVMNQSKRVLKKSGHLMSVFLSRSGYMSYLLAKQPESLVQDPEAFRDIMTQGFDPHHPRNGTFRGYFSDLNEVAEFHKSSDLQIQKLFVLDPCIAGLDAVFNRLPEDLKMVWAEVLFAFSSDPTYWNSGRTWLVIANKS